MSLVYTIRFGNELSVQKGRIIRKVESVLTDKRGWLRMGYKFRLVYEKGDEKGDGERVHTREVDFVIMFVTGSYIEKVCKFSGLSCADINKKIIYMNIDNWRSGKRLSGLNKEDYRTYMINHEVGHILGRGHNKPGKPGTRVPVMVQQTLGISQCRPNPWPLYWE